MTTIDEQSSNLRLSELTLDRKIIIADKILESDGRRLFSQPDGGFTSVLAEITIYGDMRKVGQQEMEDLMSGDRLYEGDCRLQAKLSRYSNLSEPGLMIGLALGSSIQLRRHVDLDIPVREAEEVGPLGNGCPKVVYIVVR